eukprot:1151315-Pelagomonas_calceolata.AAC.2
MNQLPRSTTLQFPQVCTAVEHWAVHSLALPETAKVEASSTPDLTSILWGYAALRQVSRWTSGGGGRSALQQVSRWTGRDGAACALPFFRLPFPYSSEEAAWTPGVS